MADEELLSIFVKIEEDIVLLFKLTKGLKEAFKCEDWDKLEELFSLRQTTFNDLGKKYKVLISIFEKDQSLIKEKREALVNSLQYLESEDQIIQELIATKREDLEKGIRARNQVKSAIKSYAQIVRNSDFWIRLFGERPHIIDREY